MARSSSLGGLGSNKRSFRLPILSLASGGLLLAAIIMFALELVRFQDSRDLIQTDITVAGVPVAGLRLSEAAATWERVYQQSVELSYQGHPILLPPSDVGFTVKSDIMQAEIRAKTAQTSNYWGDFWNYLWRRPTNPIEVALVADYSEARLRDFLQDVAQRYDRAASGGAFDLNTMTFGAGASGLRLDVDAAISEIEKALFKPQDRRVQLPMRQEGARATDMNALRQAVLQFLQTRGFNPNGPDTLLSAGVIDLQSGAEMWLNPNIAYSSASTVKIPILINYFAQMAFEPDTDIRWLMAASILCSNNPSSNLLMQVTGVGGSAGARLVNGLQKVNATMEALGTSYTFINAPLLVQGEQLISINDNPPPAPNPNFDAQPDRWSRTTPEDMATLLQELYDCAEYGSGLAAALPDNYTQTECKQMVELLSGNIIGRMIELGVPAGTRVAHKNGWAPSGVGYNNSDAAIIYTPGGNYILVIYTWEKLKAGYQVGDIATWNIMEEISRIVYNYFNPAKPLTVARVPELPYTALDCVMPDPQHPERIDLNNIRNGRFDANGYLEADACYGFPACGADQPPASFRPGGG